MRFKLWFESQTPSGVPYYSTNTKKPIRPGDTPVTDEPQKTYSQALADYKARRAYEKELMARAQNGDMEAQLELEKIKQSEERQALDMKKRVQLDKERLNDLRRRQNEFRPRTD